MKSEREAVAMLRSIAADADPRLNFDGNAAHREIVTSVADHSQWIKRKKFASLVRRKTDYISLFKAIDKLEKRYKEAKSSGNIEDEILVATGFDFDEVDARLERVADFFKWQREMLRAAREHAPKKGRRPGSDLTPLFDPLIEVFEKYARTQATVIRSTGDDKTPRGPIFEFVEAVIRDYDVDPSIIVPSKKWRDKDEAAVRNIRESVVIAIRSLRRRQKAMQPGYLIDIAFSASEL